MAFAREENCLSPYRKLLLDLDSELSTSDLEKLKYASIDLIPRGTIENVTSGLKFFDVLEQDVRITPQNLSLLENMLIAIGRMDLAWKIRPFSASQFVSDGSNRIAEGGDTNDAVLDGGGRQYGDSNSAGNESEAPGNGGGNPSIEVPDGGGTQYGDNNSAGNESEALRNRGGNPSIEDKVDEGGKVEFDVVVPDGIGDELGRDYKTVTVMDQPLESSSQGGSGPAHTLASVPAVAACSQVQTGQHSRLQQDLSDNPAPVRYVNYLAYEGYSVEIIGGKHFKTPDGEFVEIKSGTQYKIHVKNSRAYGCNLDISIDGYDVGGWVVNGGQELTIERPAYEAKLFTFYRVKTAPKEAGIESGRSENGVVKCVFTPEAFLDIPVIISGLPEPLKVNIAPTATVGDLKREVQSQRNISDDPDQILVFNGKVQSNPTRLRHVLNSPGNLRLIDTELEITVEVSTNEIFPVKIRPGKAKVIDLMAQIERKLEVPIKDQKLYYGTSRLSNTPQRGLPEELICSLEPTVVVIVPEYIVITVEDSVTGNSSIVKIDKEKNLTDLMEEIPSCRNMQENKRAMFYVNGKELCPSKDEGTLTSLGISSGSKVELKVTISFIEINVAGLPGVSSRRGVWFRCEPQETFGDLLNKIEARHNRGKLEGTTFASDQRVFDPEEDTRPLQDYGIEHLSTLMLKMAEPQSNHDSTISQEAGASQREHRKIKKISATTPEHEEGKKKTSFLGRTLSKLFGRKKAAEQRRPRITATLGIHDSDDEVIAQGGSREPNSNSRENCLREIAVPNMSLYDEMGYSSAVLNMSLYDESWSEKRTAKRHGSSGAVVQMSYSCLSLSGDENPPLQQTTRHVLTENDPKWRSGGTTLQGYSTQHFIPADPIKVDPSMKIDLVLRLVAREDETELVFPKDECKPLSTLYPPAVPE